jgi:hypothetical protein
MSMKFETELQSNALKANFTEVQQAYFDRLMSELEVISGGLGFSELKEKAEAGSKEALQVMRDYIAKKEEVVEFIETKKTVFEKFPTIKGEIKVSDLVLVINPEDENYGKKYGVSELENGIAKFVGQSTFHGYETSINNIARFYSIKELDKGVARLINSTDVRGMVYTPLDMQAYMNVRIGDKFRYTEKFKEAVSANHSFVDAELIEIIGFVRSNNVFVLAGEPENFVAAAMRFTMPDGTIEVEAGNVAKMVKALERIA